VKAVELIICWGTLVVLQLLTSRRRCDHRSMMLRTLAVLAALVCANAFQVPQNQNLASHHQRHHREAAAATTKQQRIAAARAFLTTLANTVGDDDDVS